MPRIRFGLRVWGLKGLGGGCNLNPLGGSWVVIGRVISRVLYL